jgi:ribonuclease HI
VVCINAEGHYLGASARVIEDFIDPASLEALACVEALSLASDLNEQHIHIATDCLQVINNLHDGSIPRYGALLKEIKIRKQLFGSASFTHERREHNMEAHNLAKYVFSLPFGRHIWLQNPPEVCCIPLNITQ